MSKNRLFKRQSKGAVTTEWLLGVRTMPAYVADGTAGSYRPELLLALEVPKNIILGFEVCKKAELAKAMEKLFGDLSGKSEDGRRLLPEAVRTSVPEYAELLRALVANPEVVRCAPTPELDPVMEPMLERFGCSDSELPIGYLERDIPERVVEEFYRGTAELFRAAPWRMLPADLPIELDIPSLGIDAGVVTVIGANRESLGYIYFECLADFNTYVRMATTLSHGVKPVSTPAHVVLNFDPASEVALALRREQADHGWEVASEHAFPQLYVVDEDFVLAPPESQDLERVTIISRALAAWILNDLSGITLRQPWSCDRAVQGSAEPVMVTLRSPGSPRRGGLVDGFDIGAAAIDPEDYSLDQEWAEELIHLFLEAPEGAQADGQWVAMFMEYLASHEGCTVAQMTPGRFEAVLFRLFPNKVSVAASAAAEIVDELSAFMRFLVRRFGLSQAEKCLGVLSRDATERLRRELGDPSNFGMAKRFFMEGEAAGYDMTSERGLQEFSALCNRDNRGARRGIPQGREPRPSRGASPMKAKTAADRNKAKAQRKARKIGKK